MDSILVVFYSNTGNSRRLAQLLSTQKGWPTGEVVEQHPRSSMLRSVLDSLLRRRPAVQYKGPDPTGFRTVVLVAPIWMYRLASPMRTFVHDWRKQLDRVAVLVTMGRRGGSNAAAEIGNILGHDPVLSEVVTARAIEDGSCAEAVNAFGDALVPPAGVPPVRPAVLSPEAG